MHKKLDVVRKTRIAIINLISDLSTEQHNSRLPVNGDITLFNIFRNTLIHLLHDRGSVFAL